MYHVKSATLKPSIIFVAGTNETLAALTMLKSRMCLCTCDVHPWQAISMGLRRATFNVREENTYLSRYRKQGQ